MLSDREVQGARSQNVCNPLGVPPSSDGGTGAITGASVRVHPGHAAAGVGRCATPAGATWPAPGAPRSGEPVPAVRTPPEREPLAQGVLPAVP
ncbi:hypothetical protein Sm713_61800 [Streptomyces sp. TS71-3]|nr:hypothetical protein Sm713_61800 [Streptomyces sp. TS71-3]